MLSRPCATTCTTYFVTSECVPQHHITLCVPCRRCSRRRRGWSTSPRRWIAPDTVLKSAPKATYTHASVYAHARAHTTHKHTHAHTHVCTPIASWRWLRVQCVCVCVSVHARTLLSPEGPLHHRSTLSSSMFLKLALNDTYTYPHAHAHYHRVVQFNENWPQSFAQSPW